MRIPTRFFGSLSISAASLASLLCKSSDDAAYCARSFADSIDAHQKAVRARSALFRKRVTEFSMREDPGYAAAPMYARQFALSCHMVGACVEKLQSELSDANLLRISNDFNRVFPWAKDIRDSIAHVDERVMGRAVLKGKKVALTGIVATGSVWGGSLVFTAADNQQRTVPIDEASLQTLLAITESALQAVDEVARKNDATK